MKQRIVVLGAGRMGSALVESFLAAGHAVDVWNRTASRCAPLVAKGARAVTNLAASVAEADIVVGNVYDYAATYAALEAADVARALRGKPFVQLASGTPSQAKEAAAWAERLGASFLDGAIMATPNFIGQEGCTILYSGPKPVFDAVAPALRALGGATTYVGADIGHANALDNALLVVLWGSLYGVLQGAAICQAESFPLEGFSASLRGFMPVIDESLMSAIQRIGQRRFGADETTPATVETCRASVAYILQMSRERGIDPGLPQALDGLFQRAMDAGRAGDDFASVYQGMR